VQNDSPEEALEDTSANEAFLWWLGDPRHPRLIGSLRLLADSGRVSNGVSLEYGESWLGSGFALSEDLPLRKGEAFPMERDSAVGAVDDARPDRRGERVIRHVIRPPRLSRLDYLYFAGDQRFGALGASLCLLRVAVMAIPS
jgi:serine/threonine-protein kinase HipA